MAVSVKLCADIDRRLRAIARQRNSSHHYMMCEAIRRFVEDEEARLHGDGIVPSPSDDRSIEIERVRFSRSGLHANSMSAE